MRVLSYLNRDNGDVVA